MRTGSNALELAQEDARATPAQGPPNAAAARRWSKPTIVIGAGLAGAATAYALAARGVCVEIIDAADEIASGSSHSNGGLLTPSMSDPWNSPGLPWLVLRSIFNGASPLKVNPLIALGAADWGLAFLRNSTTARFLGATRRNYLLARFSMEKTTELRESLGLDFDCETQGSLKVFRTDVDLNRSLAIARMLADQGMTYRVVSAGEAAQIEPLLAGSAQELAGALYFPDDAVGDARKFTRQLVERFEGAGGRLRLDTRVSAIDIEKSAVRGVQTDKGYIAASNVVVAAGFASARILNRHGVGLKIEPVKGYSLTIGCDVAPLPSVSIVDDSLHTVVTRLGDKLRVAGVAEIAGADTSIAACRLRDLFSSLERMYPQFAAGRRPTGIVEWAGLRPVSADGVPYIGGTPFDGLYVNTGHGHLGWTMAAGSGHLLAEFMIGEPTSIDIRPYAVGRR